MDKRYPGTRFTLYYELLGSDLPPEQKVGILEVFPDASSAFPGGLPPWGPHGEGLSAYRHL